MRNSFSLCTFGKLTTMKRSELTIFLTIVFAQFCGTSLWFAGNAAINAIEAGISDVTLDWMVNAPGYVTIAVQAGFIAGTLLVSITGIIDRYSPSKVFFISCIVGALFNISLMFNDYSFPWILTTRVAVGICLAGIYPVGMKIASDWQEKGLGNWLGALVGALVLGTAFPHVIQMKTGGLLLGVSCLAVIGGVMMLKLVPDGPYRKPSPAFSFKAVSQAFHIKNFRRPALGYFGHMWEVYAFWAFVPIAINYYSLAQENFMIDESPLVNESSLAFIIIAAGALGCWIGGKLSAIAGSEKIAFYMLLVSGICCALSPWIWHTSPVVFVTFMIVWGFSAAADSPQFLDVSSSCSSGGCARIRDHINYLYWIFNHDHQHSVDECDGELC